MTLWLARAASHGEQEQRFLDGGQSYVAWEGLSLNLAPRGERQALI